MTTRDTSNEREVEFESSSLGTKEHWDSQYKTELKNFEEIGDIGEVWFGEDSVERVSRWIERQGLPSDCAVLDLGCGNGASLLSLEERGYTNLTGVDYSQSAIELARQIAEKQECNIKFQVCDLLQESLDSGPALSHKYDLCLDKGTYDAICLCPDDAATKRQIYKRNVGRLLTTPGGLFIITSCNWTAEELKRDFTGQDFQFRCVIPTPKLQFGGSEGSSTSVLVFTKLS